MARGALATIAAVLVLFATGVDVQPPADAVGPCAGRAFAWGGHGECWGRLDGRDFASWLNRHGSSAARFKRNYPELAAVFRRPWPPAPPYWKTCSSGYACVVAVLPHYFGPDIGYELSIVKCETGGTFSQYVVGDAGEVSIWQIHPVHFGWVDERRAVADIRYATSVAYRLSEGGRDWSPWTCA